MLKEKKRTHVVIKQEDISKYLSLTERGQLKEITKRIVQGRVAEGKPINSYYVCNTDEPYAEKVLNIILTEGKEECPEV